MKIPLAFVLSTLLALSAAASLQAQSDTGSGEVNTVPLWTGTTKLGDSIISQSGTDVSVKGTVEATNSSSFGVIGTSKSSTGVAGFSTGGNGVSGHTDGGFGVQGQSNSSTGVFGISDSGFGISGSSLTNYGVKGTSTSNTGVFGESTKGNGVQGTSTTKSGVGVDGFNASGVGVSGTSDSSTGVLGFSTSGVGVHGSSSTDFGVEGQSDSDDGVFGVSTSGFGVSGSSVSNIGVHGSSTKTNGVLGESTEKAGVVGENTDGDGIGGISCDSCQAAAVVGIGHIAGSFTGFVLVGGDLSVTGVKAFHIDHPLDPANKYLNHFATESNEVLDTYSGNVTTDRGGTATVELPDYFEALNTNFRYQLTVIGQFAQAIVSEEIQKNRFVIKTDRPEVKVSWQVIGVRSDAYVKAHPMPVEQEKPEQERGYYLAPEVFGQPEEKSITWLYHSELVRDARAMKQARRAQAAARAEEQKSEQQAAVKLQ